MNDPKEPLPGAPENPEEGLSFPGEDGDTGERAIIDDTRDRDANEIERDDDAPLSERDPQTER